MKNTFTRFASVILVSSVLLGGCKKEKDNDDTTPPAKTKTELISTGTWKFSTATIGGGNAAGFLQPCQKDNTLTFAAAGTGTVDEGGTKCNAGDPQSSPYTWNFASSETVLHVSAVFFTGGSNDYNVVEISATKLIGSQSIEIGGTPQTVIVTFIH
ncbi:MAG: lipocalin family protein [Chitinophagaceae bacterium]